MTHDPLTDTAVFKCHPNIEMNPNTVEPVVCIPSIKRSSKFAPPIVTSTSIQLKEYAGPIMFCVRDDELAYYHSLLQEQDKLGTASNWMLLVRPTAWNDQGVRFAREALLLAATCLFPAAATVHFDDDRTEFRRHADEAGAYICPPILETMTSVVEMLAFVASEGKLEGGLKGKQLVVVALGSSATLKNTKAALYDVTVTGRANQAIHLAPKHVFHWISFTSPVVRRLSVEEYAAWKVEASKKVTLEYKAPGEAATTMTTTLKSPFLGIEDYELCYRAAAEGQIAVYCNRWISVGVDEHELPTSLEDGAHTDVLHVELLKLLYEKLAGYSRNTNERVRRCRLEAEATAIFERGHRDADTAFLKLLSEFEQMQELLRTKALQGARPS